MKMIKLVALLAVALLAFTACQAQPTAPEATATPVISQDPTQEIKEDETADVLEMAGVVTEITEDYLLITDAQGQEIQVNLSAETIYEGDQPAVGDYIHVLYDGKMTRSLPPQIFGMKIGCYIRTGAISALDDNGFTLGGEEEIRVNAPAALLTGLENGMTVSVYFSGAMTMSLPAQIGAEHIVIR